MNVKYRAGVVGVRGIGRRHAREILASDRFELVGLADRDPGVLAEVSAELDPSGPGVPTFVSWPDLLRETRPDVAVVSTPNLSHFALAIQAVEFGVRAVFCEKPMTVDWGDARKLYEACRSSGTELIVNHQRRTLPEMRTMARLIAGGAIGEVQVLRACHAGDVISDGTHAVDSLRFLAGDPGFDWVVAGMARSRSAPPPEAERTGFEKISGWRFGHPVEDAMISTWQFSNGIRGEMTSGEIFPKGRWYQDYEAVGSRGSLWRPSDGQEPKLRRLAADGRWEEVPLDPPGPTPLDMLADTLERGVPHPMGGSVGLEDMRLVTAIYAAAVRRAKIGPDDLPDEFPLKDGPE
ncbi:MAG: Gfo/Idh/MocA family oxidoreductase [Fimbriimonadaceae bacterium]